MLAALQADLLTPEMAELFEAEFRREVELEAKRSAETNPDITADIRRVEAELGNLSANLRAGVVGPTMMTMTAARDWNVDPPLADTRADDQPNTN